MATIPFTITRMAPGLDVIQAVWTPLSVDDDGAPVEMPERSDRSIHVRGSFGGATVTIQGSNEATPTSWVTLTAPSGALLTFTAGGLRQVTEITRWIRPISVGGAGASITVEMIAQ